jgi:hypothetical protein
LVLSTGIALARSAALCRYAPHVSALALPTEKNATAVSTHAITAIGKTRIKMACGGDMKDVVL